jgi:hypothetical protein
MKRRRRSKEIEVKSNIDPCSWMISDTLDIDGTINFFYYINNIGFHLLKQSNKPVNLT